MSLLDAPINSFSGYSAGGLLGPAKGQTAQALRRAGYDVDKYLEQEARKKRAPGFFQKYILRPLTYIPRLEAQLVTPTPGPWWKEFTEAAKPGAPTIGAVITKKMKPGWGRTLLATAADIGLAPTTYLGLYGAKGALAAVRGAGVAAGREAALAGAKGVSEVAIAAAEKVATEAAVHGSAWRGVRELVKTSVGSAKSLAADTAFLERTARLGDVAGRAVPKTAFGWGVGFGKYATIVSPERVQKIGFGIRGIAEKVPVVGAATKMLTTRWVRPTALAPGKLTQEMVPNVFADLRARGVAETGNIVDAVQQHLSTLGLTSDDVAHNVAAIYQKFTPKQQELLMQLQNAVDLPLEVREAQIVPFEKLLAETQERLGKMGLKLDDDMLHMLRDRIRSETFSPMEVILAKFPPHLQAAAREMVETTYPAIRAVSYLYKQVPRQAAAVEQEAARLGGAVDRARRIEDAIGGLLGPHPFLPGDVAVDRLRTSVRPLTEVGQKAWRSALDGLQELGASLKGGIETWREQLRKLRGAAREVTSPVLKKLLPENAQVKWSLRVGGGRAYTQQGKAVIGLDYSPNPLNTLITLLHEVGHLRNPGLKGNFGRQFSERAADAFAIAEARRMGIDISKWDIDYALLTAARVGETPRTSARAARLWRDNTGVWRVLGETREPIPPRRGRAPVGVVAAGLEPGAVEPAVEEAYKAIPLWTTRTLPSGRKVPIRDPAAAALYRELRGLGATPEGVKAAFKATVAGERRQAIETVAAQLGLRTIGKVLADAAETSILHDVPQVLALARARGLPDTLEGLLQHLATEPIGAMRQDGLIEDIARAYIDAKLPGYQEFYIHGVRKGQAMRTPRYGVSDPLPSLLPKTFQHNPIMREYVADVWEAEAQKAAAAGFNEHARMWTDNAKKIRPEKSMMAAVADDLWTAASNRLRNGFAQRFLALAKTKKEVLAMGGTTADWVPISAWHEFKGLLFPREAAEAFERIRPSFTMGGDDLNALAKAHGAFMGLFKRTAVAGPGLLRWIEANLGGNLWLMFLGGFKSPTKLAQGFIASRIPPKIEPLAGVVARETPRTLISGPLDALANALRRLVPDSFYAPALGRRVTLEELSQLWREGGGMKTFAQGEFLQDVLKRGNWNPVSPEFHWVKNGMELNTGIERGGYMALFADRLAKGDSIRDAATHTRRFLFDYGDLTEWEKKYGKNILPFYTWIRKNVALHLRMLWEQPGKPGAIAKFIQDTDLNAPEYPPELKPSWMGDVGAMRGAAQGKPTYYLPQIPFLDITRVMSARQISGSLHPAAGYFMKSVFGRDPFTGQPVSKRQAFMEAMPWISTPARISRLPPAAQKESWQGLYMPWRPYRVDLFKGYQRLEMERAEALARLARRAEAAGRMEPTRQRIAQRRRVSTRLQRLGISEEMME